ncbi:MAG: DUF4867 family protein [Planctomycetia bacterium]|nr:DUF4867 family protein [Planctomycetia bacterium]
MAEQMKIYRPSDSEFAPYGKLLNLDVTKLLNAAKELEMPHEGAAYTPAVPSLEACPEFSVIEERIYGEMPIQIGVCLGYNRSLNALEWHKSSELNIAVTDFILLLGKIEEMRDGRFDSSQVKAFLIKAGETVEIYATSLHFCPIQTSNSGFNCVVVLPRGTNLPLTENTSDPLLFCKNKWLICHEGNERLKQKSVVPAIHGENNTF